MKPQCTPEEGRGGQSSLAIITTAGSDIGMGHAARQLAVAETALARGMTVHVISDSPLVEHEFVRLGVSHLAVEDVRSAEELASHLDSLRPENVIIDVHERDFPKLRVLTDEDRRVGLVVSRVGFDFDPYGHRIFLIGSDLDRWDVHKEAGATTIRSGRAYMLFRSEFADDEGVNGDDRTVLIAHGGSDQYGLTHRCLRALEQTVGRYRCVVLVGPAVRSEERARIVAAAKESSHACEIVEGTRRPSTWMRRATLALISGGNIRYELCITGTPFVAVAYNQRQYDCTEQIARLGAGTNLGTKDGVEDRDIARAVDTLMANDQAREDMRRTMQGLFDLHGADRVLDSLLSTPKQAGT